MLYYVWQAPSQASNISVYLFAMYIRHHLACGGSNVSSSKNHEKTRRKRSKGTDSVDTSLQTW